MGLAPEHLCRLGFQPVRGAYTNLIYMCRTSHQLSSLTCPSAPSPRGPLASADSTRLVSSAVQICRCFIVSPHSTYAIDCPILKRINNLSWLQKIRIIGCPNEQVLKGVPSLDSMRWDYWCHHGDTFGIPNISKPEVSQVDEVLVKSHLIWEGQDQSTTFREDED